MVPAICRAISSARMKKISVMPRANALPKLPLNSINRPIILINSLTTEKKLSISRFLTRSSYVLLLAAIAANLWTQSAPWIVFIFYLLPLAIFLPGMMADTVRNLIWMGFALLVYFAIVVYKVSVPEPRALDITELVLTVVLFSASMIYARIRQTNNL